MSVFKIKSKKFDLLSGNSSRFLVNRIMLDSKDAPTTKKYIELEYIEGTGTQWIDTRQYGTDKTKIQTKVFLVESTGELIVGYLGTNDSADYRIFNAYDTLYWDIMTSRLIGSSFLPNAMHEFECGNNYVKDLATGSNLVSGSAVATFKTAGTIKLFYADGMPVDGYDKLTTKAKIYYLKMYESNSLVLDLIPVKDKNDVVCMYDKVSDTFFYNQGTGNFIAGPEV